MSRSEPILDPEDLRSLLAEGTLRHVQGESAHLIHKRRLNRSSEEEYAALSLPSPSPTASSPITGGNISTDSFHTIPEFRISREALLYAGFTHAAADQIWQNWSSWPASDDGRETDDGLVTFESMATAHVRSTQRNAFGLEDSQWFEAMNAYGIAAPLQEGIMAPAYQRIRLTSSCQYWVLDTVKARFAGLRAIQAASRERSRAAAREGNSPGSGYLSPSRDLVEPSHRRVSPASLALEHPGISPKPASSPCVRASAPDMTVLWKGAYQARIDPHFGANNTITEFGPMISSPGGDFNSAGGAFYFALDHEVAEHYASYAKRRSPGEAVVILRLEVPNLALESLIPPEKLTAYYPSETFQKLVWTCRRNGRMRQELLAFARATLVIGHICRLPNEVVVSMPGFHDIVSNDLLRTSAGNAAVQYAFISEQGAQFLEDHRVQCTAHLFSWHHAEDIERVLASTEA